jgi:serine/threonine protein phosphatase PrpC
LRSSRGTSVAFGHVGDSRAYRLRDSVFEQVTEDHSLVNELLKSGKLSPEEADLHPQRSVITRAVGTDPDVDVDAFTIEAEIGDVFLLCSDGLTDMVDDDEIRDLLDRNRRDLDRATKSLVSAANRGGGEDNITVVAFAISAGGETAELQSLEDTMENVPLPAVDTMVVPADQVEHVLVEPGSPEAEAMTRREPISSTARFRLVLTMVVLLVVAAVLLVWGFVR